ncbi:transcription factor 24 [Strongylocentrotus purpuratus]|uniref:BHLH domain-containing protein n=1 Tax=Strongylocentrotus purpuratus TaxID=7668 RepID=A0A7M7RC44_STRPU|nr:transcription factor 24 [Strongylocentrotus purpuratus]
MADQTGAENMSFLESLVLEPPSLSMDKLEEISPVLTELTSKPKTTNIKSTRRGRKRNADKITKSGPTTTSSPGENNVVTIVTAGSTTDVKPKRGRGRPAGSTNRTSNKLTAQAAAAVAASAAATATADGIDDPNDPVNAARERSRVKTLRDAFLELQRSLPSVPPDTKLSKLDVLVLATTYISHLMRTLDKDQPPPLTSPGEDVTACLDKHHRLKAQGYLHPVKKWPMRSRLYAGASADRLLDSSS